MGSTKGRYCRSAVPGALLFMLFCLSSCSSMRTTGYGKPLKSVPDIRVLIDSTDYRLDVATTGAFSLYSAYGKKLFYGSKPAELRFSSQASGILASVEPGGQTASIGSEMRIVPERGTYFSHGGVMYAGVLRVVGGSNNLMLINVLPVETYLEGVLPHELGVGGPDDFAALEAQAVAARTYALARMRDRKKELFDVRADVQDQVYLGRKGILKMANTAIKKTWGLVIEYKGSIAFAYYCANCGGHTSDISLMWPKRRSAPYLTGVRDSGGGGSFCRNGKYFRWRYSFSGSELGSLLRETLPRELCIEKSDVGYLRDLSIVGRSRSGRVTEIEVETSKGKFEVKGDRIRWLLLVDRKTGRILPSTMFDIQRIKEGGRLVFATIVGGGNGHGVGMCQTGALEMAREGYTFEMILAHYYPNCSLVNKY